MPPVTCTTPLPAKSCTPHPNTRSPFTRNADKRPWSFWLAEEENTVKKCSNNGEVEECAV